MIESSRQLADQSKPEQSNRAFGFVFILIQVGCMIGYGLVGSFFPEDNSFITSYSVAFSTIFLTLFVLVGFGLLLSSFQYGTWLGMVTALVVVAISVQFSPLIQKLLFSILLTGFGSQNLNSAVGDNILSFWQHYSLNIIQDSFFTTRTSLISCVSILTMMLAVVGRMDVPDVVKMTTAFQVLWNTNYFLMIWFAAIKQDFSSQTLFTPYIFDEFGTTNVYIFACGFGFVMSLFMWKKQIIRSNPRNKMSDFSTLIASIGTAFIFACFMFTSNNFIEYTKIGQKVAKMNILFSIIGSVTINFAGSALLGGGRAGYKNVLISTLTGGIAIGYASSIITNIGISLAIGSVTGLLSSIYMATLHKRLNKYLVYDWMGLFGPVFISSFFGAFVVTPSVLAWDYDRGNINLGMGDNVPLGLASYQLVFGAISFALGIVGGFLAILMNICNSPNFQTASNMAMVQYDFGLFSRKPFNISQEIARQSAVRNSTALKQSSKIGPLHIFSSNNLINNQL